MTEISQNIYDNGGIGDGNLTETIAYPNGNAGTAAVGTARVTLMNYDWRDRLVATSDATGTSTASFSNVAVGAVSSLNIVPEMAQSIQTESFSGSDGRIVWRPIPNAGSITVQQSTDGGSTWTTVSGSGGIPGTADTWLPTGLLPSMTYYYRIQASNAAGVGPWSPTVSLTTLSTAASPQYYQVSLGPDTNIRAADDDVMNVQDSSQAVAVDSWQQAMLLGASGSAENLTLGQTVTIGGFVQASGGAGYSGNSFGFLVDSTGLAYDDTAANYYYNQNQPDHHQNSSWLSFSITLTDSSNNANTLTQAAGVANGEFALNANPSTGEAALTVDVSSLQFGGPDYPSPGPDIIWQVSGATATPASGDFGTNANPQITLDPTDNYIFTLTAGVAIYSGSSSIDTTKPEAVVNIDVLHGGSISIGYVGGTNAADGTAEGEKVLAVGQDFLKGYMLDLKAPAIQAGTNVTWSVTKVGGGNMPVGTFHAGGGWDAYQTVIPPPGPNGPVAYWTSDTAGTITDQYVISCTYTPVGAQAPVTITRTIASRELQPTGTMASQFNADVDMLQRLMMQDFYLDKGRLSQYNIGEYQGITQATYTTSNKFAGLTVQYSPVAEEVKNYEQFSMGNNTNPSTTLDLATLQSMWNMFTQIQQASESLSQGEIGNGVTSADPNYNAWVQAAIAGLPAGESLLSQPLPTTNGQKLDSEGLLKGWATWESAATQSIPNAAPIAAGDEDTNVGEEISGSHYYTDDGIGFMQVQFYNEVPNVNLFDPEQNLARAATIIAGFMHDNNNPGVPAKNAAETLWYAAYRYNCGDVSYGTGAGGLNTVGKNYADGLFAALHLALPSGL